MRRTASTIQQCQLIAEIAARLMATEGYTDPQEAKRKAARQAGLSDIQHLPSDQELDIALQRYRQLFQAEQHPAELARIRQAAVGIMRQLADFTPYLTGPVWTGSASIHSPIRLLIFTDNPKDIEYFLLNAHQPYRHLPASRDDHLQLSWHAGEWLVELSILPRRSARHKAHDAEGQPARGRLPQLLQRIAQAD